MLAIEEKSKLIPNGWTWTKISQIAYINPSVDYTKLSNSDSVTFVPMAAVDEYKGSIASPMILPLDEARKGHTKFQDEDIIFARITPCMENGKIAIAKNLENGIGFGSTEFLVLRPKKGIIPEYLYYFIRQESFRNFAASHMTSTVGQQRVPKNIIENANIPLPPTEEQKRIVRKIESLLQENRKAKESLDKIPPILRKMRYSSLSLAFSGKLVEQDPSDESVKKILSRITDETWKELYKKIGIRKKTRVEITKDEYEIIEHGKFSSLPNGWLQVKISDICITSSGGTPSRVKKEYYEGNIPWVKSGELEDNFISKTQEFLSDIGLKHSSAKIFPIGTVLLAMYGATVGKTAILEIEACTNQAICGLFHDDKILNNEYLFFYLQSKRDMLIQKSFGGAQPNISQGLINKIEIPLPPINEQKRIVKKIKYMLGLNNIIEKSVKEEMERILILQKSLFQKAFLGELVEQDPNDEHASILLERIGMH